ncbi:two-component system response regulator HydG [Desulfobotulus alkaliphilus]|uniref:Two-component system response regulator HydG n=1 Tax=Desulfobotulus alkaliphilus TaxID=622671 RepID=A0A562RMS0_9BACT|nr:sigma-54 dependent transcriptional regulator [Desulfobotulus alkaliphilus]TWI70332.1 two-component system response regulator HydG [Desulfobotulus alkaliphilus]
MATAKILVVDDDDAHRKMLKTLLSGFGYGIEEAQSGEEALERVKKDAMDTILMDVRMAGISGIEALEQMLRWNPTLPIIIMTAYSSVDSARRALKAGAYDYLTKPLDFDELNILLSRSLEHSRLKDENRRLKEQVAAQPGFPDIIGKSPAMKKMMEMLRAMANSEATVLITGPSGTGKELIAKAIHATGPRKNRPFIPLNCAAFTDALLESELFGHEKGAFTGADRRREGRFMQADGGTLFLDEIGETSPAMQAKLLRALQEGEVQRVGSDKVLRVDVRILAATNRDLLRCVREKTFREDLFYRLNVLNLQIPPLNERNGDIPLLAHHFLRHYAEKNRKHVLRFSPRAMDALLHHKWPGNVRELENAVERAVILCPADTITEDHLPMGMADSLPSGEPGKTLADLERQAIFSTLDQTAGNKSEAARILGITRATLHNKLKLYGEA